MSNNLKDGKLSSISKADPVARAVVRVADLDQDQRGRLLAGLGSIIDIDPSLMAAKDMSVSRSRRADRSVDDPGMGM